MFGMFILQVLSYNPDAFDASIVSEVSDVLDVGPPQCIRCTESVINKNGCHCCSSVWAGIVGLTDANRRDTESNQRKISR